MVLGVARKLGVLGEAPPKKITKAAFEAADVAPSRATTSAATVVAHYGFGAATGALFGLTCALGLWKPTALSGAIFGTLVWATSYLGWVPALGIMPPAHRDRPGRPAAMIAAHWVYGVSLAGAYAASEPAT